MGLTKSGRAKIEEHIKATKKSKKVSSMRTEDKDEPLAVVCSCIHLSHNPPVARSIEDDWYVVMREYLEQLKGIATDYTVPIICCGDVFDKPDAPPELISFAIKHLPTMYAIPGQHDLPHHNYDDLKKSAFWTLVEAGTIINLKPYIQGELNEVHTSRRSFYVAAFPWGFEIEKTGKTEDFILSVAHSYIWKSERTSYSGAPPSKHAEEWAPKLQGFHACVFGDNHKGFTYGPNSTVFNCGTFMRRKADEINYSPRVGILYRDGRFEKQFLNVEDDKFINMDDACAIIEKAIDATDFLKEFQTLGRKIADFGDAVWKWCEKNNVPKEVRTIISKAMEQKK